MLSLVLTTCCLPIISLHKAQITGPSIGRTQIYTTSSLQARCKPKYFPVVCERGSKPCILTKLSSYKFLIHWMKLAILMAIKQVFEPTRGDRHWTQSQEYQVRLQCSAQQSEPHIPCPHECHPQCTKVCHSWEATHRLLSCWGRVVQWSKLNKLTRQCADKSWEAIFLEDPSVRPESPTYFWAKRGKIDSEFWITPEIVTTLNDYIRKTETVNVTVLHFNFQWPLLRALPHSPTPS